MSEREQIQIGFVGNPKLRKNYAVQCLYGS